MFKIQWDTCINTLENVLDGDTLNVCHDFIKIRRERRHYKTLERQLSKFHHLCQQNTTGHSSPEHGEHGKHGHTRSKNFQYTRNNNSDINIDVENNRETIEEEEDNERSDKNWVRNISKIPLTHAQEKLLSHGPNFVIVPKEPPTSEYIAAIEKHV